MVKFIKNKLIEKFNDSEIISRKELYDFYKSFEPDLKESTFSWRIYDLKRNNIIKPIKRSSYIISKKPIFKPLLDNRSLEIANFIAKRYQDVKFCVWETSWLNEFSQHLISKKITIIEAEKDIVESIYYDLRDNFSYDIFINPDVKSINFYIAESSEPIVLKNLISRSPLRNYNNEQGGFNIPSLEKILVDIYSDDKLFYFIQGSEYERIFRNAFEKYVIDQTILINYASRRGKKEIIKNLIHNYFNSTEKVYIK
jgi:hypothetical protein